MAAFLHAAPEGGRLNGPHLGAWYATASLTTAVAEVAHHLRRETVPRRSTEARPTHRCDPARLTGCALDALRCHRAEPMAPHV